MNRRATTAPQNRPFQEYLAYLEQLTLPRERVDEFKSDRRILAALDGEPSSKVRALFSARTIKKSGAFFTGQKLATRAVAHLVRNGFGTIPIIDPACGAGDLLVACARHLPVAPGITNTLKAWGNQLIGYDVRSEFVQATRIRLTLAALQQGVSSRLGDSKDIDSCFQNVHAGDGLKQSAQWASPVIVVMNPPFTLVRAPAGCKWASGRVSSAAIFFEEWLSKVPADSRMVAILPDVLRTGSRYKHWRGRVEELGRVKAVEVVGQFQPWADIDVFILSLVVGKKRPSSARWWTPPKAYRSSGVVGDHFDVSVGPVVPYRDPRRGPLRAYLHARTSPPWGEVCRASERRRFRGKVLNPPFVVVRRTSRPGDEHRAVGTLIVGIRAVAVENHLLVLSPKTGGRSSCLALLKILRSAKTTRWLNERIRCRHLTVKSLSELPWWK